MIAGKCKTRSEKFQVVESIAISFVGLEMIDLTVESGIVDMKFIGVDTDDMTFC
jgi:hypothetical protein